MPATIYQFPVGGRGSLTGTPNEPKPKAATPSPAITACGAAWYHEEAMKEEERTRKS